MKAPASSPERLKTAVFKGFAAQFQAQLEQNAAPTSEHGIHFCLALAIESVYRPPIGSIVFEKRFEGTRSRTDIWFKSTDTAIEIKYPKIRGKVKAGAGQYGLLLADFNRMRKAPATDRYVVLVSDCLVSWMGANGKDVLPLRRGKPTTIRRQFVESRLTGIAKSRATKTGWKDLIAELVWSSEIDAWSLRAWRVTPAN